jgi:hypothetical protein
MFGFGRKKELSARDRKEAMQRAIEKVQNGSADAPLRELLAAAHGSGTSPDDVAVTALVGDVASYGMARGQHGADPSDWWNGLAKDERVTALQQTAQCLT